MIVSFSDIGILVTVIFVALCVCIVTYVCNLFWFLLYPFKYCYDNMYYDEEETSICNCFRKNYIV